MAGLRVSLTKLTDKGHEGSSSEAAVFDQSVETQLLWTMP